MTYLRNFVNNANSDGTSPERSLLLKSKYCKFCNKPILVDNIPDSLLPGILNVTVQQQQQQQQKKTNESCRM